MNAQALVRMILCLILCTVFPSCLTGCGFRISGKPQKETVIRFTATGDNPIHERLYQQANLRAGGGENYDFDYCYESVGAFYREQDLNWIRTLQFQPKRCRVDVVTGSLVMEET